MTVVVACSGGLDSTVLAHRTAVRSAEPIVLACLDHGLRAAAADDVAFVRALASDLDARFVTDQRTPSFQRIRRVGRQAAAREVRLGWLEEIASAAGADRILLAHHRDDDLETVALGLAERTVYALQGAVAAGTAPASIPRIRGRFGRPLLDQPRSALMAEARAAGLSWREDPSNADLRYARNRLRHETLPAWRRLDPKGPERLLAAGRRTRAALDDLQRRARRVAPAVVRSVEPLVLHRAVLAALPEGVADAVLRALCVPADRPLGTAALRAVADDARAGRRARLRRLGGGWSARTSGDDVVLVRGLLTLEGVGRASAPLLVDCPVVWSGGRTLGATRLSAAEAHQRLSDAGVGRTFALVDADSVEGPLSVRAAGAGARFRPFGLDGSRLVRDVLAEVGVPRPERADWPTVVDARGRVIWIPGVRAGASAPLRSGSEAALLLYTVAASGPPDRTALEPQ